MSDNDTSYPYELCGVQLASTLEPHRRIPPVLRGFVVVVAVALLAICVVPGRSLAQQTRGPIPRPQSVALDLRTQNGVAKLHAFSFGAPYTIDPAKLWFSAHPYDRPDAVPERLDVTLGAPVFIPPTGAGSPPEKRLQEFTMRLDFPRASKYAGMYDVELHALPGFAVTPEGTPLPFGDWSRPVAEWHIVVWWRPQTTGRGIASAIRDLAGRDVYSFGGVALGCAAWSNGYTAATPIHIRTIIRERGRVEELWTGSTLAWGNDLAPHFFAVDPLRFVVDKPAATPLFTGSGGWGGASSDDDKACPAVTLADWQVDLSFVTEAPKFAGAQSDTAPRIGMSRAEVAWRLGYPTTFDDRRTFSGATIWSYKRGPRDSLTITFSDGRVASLEK